MNFKYLKFLRQQFNPADVSQAHTKNDLTDVEHQLVRFDGVRYANTLEGRLSQRDTEALRSFVLAAPSFEERERRKADLFLTANSAMSIAPSLDTGPGASLFPGSTHEPCAGVVNAGLLCLPVVFTTAKPINVYTRMSLDRMACRNFTNRLQDVILKASPTKLNSVRIESLIALKDLLGASPLTVHNAVTNETRRNAGRFKPEPPRIPADLSHPANDKWRLLQSVWSLKLEQTEDIVLAVGPKHPAAYLLVVYCTWDLHSPIPDLGRLGVGGLAQLQELLQHYLAQDQASSFGESGHINQAERINLRVGAISPLNEALTQSQGMQIQMASDIACASGLGFTTSHTSMGRILGWRAEMQGQDSDGDPLDLVVVDYTHDAFWRPERHVDEIQKVIQSSQHGSSAASKWQRHSQNVQGELPFDDGIENDRVSDDEDAPSPHSSSRKRH